MKCFQHDMDYGGYRDLAIGTVSDKLFCDKSLATSRNPKYDEYQRAFASMVYKFI